MRKTAVASSKRSPGRPSAGSTTNTAGYLALVERGRSLQLKSVTDWCNLVLTNKLPSQFPARPELEFAEKFEKLPRESWQEFLGLAALPEQDELDLLPDVDQRGYVEFEYAREMARTLRLTRAEDWYRRTGDLHPCCPREPWSVYFNKGYTTLEAFVGCTESPRP